jgi:predicted permease
MLSDLKFAFRQLAKARGFTFVALATLALGIGLNTSMFSLMNLLIIQPLPFPNRDQLVRVYRTTPQSQTANHPAPDFVELARETAPYADLAAFRMWGYTLAPEGRPAVNLNALRVSASFFPVLGMKPQIGRWFRPDEDRPDNHVIILSYAAWQAHFGGDPAVVGQNVRIDGESTTVIGVMPAAFSSIFLWGPGEAIRPLALTDREKTSHEEAEYSMIARVHPGLSLEQFNARLATEVGRLNLFRPKEHVSDGLRAVTLQSTTRSIGTIGVSWLLVGLAGFVLLIACANLANLLLARAISRSHEFAIRAALGASRVRLLRPLLGESILLAAGGGLLGVLVAVWANDWISNRLAENEYLKLTLALDWRVLSFALVVSAGTGLIFGIVPAWLMTRVRVNDALRSGTRGNTGDRAQHRLRHGLIVLQFALAVVLLAGAGFYLRGVDRLLAFDPGWDHHGMVQAVLNLPAAKYPDPARTYAFYTRLQERLEALPGVENATVGWTLPIYLFLTSRPFAVDGQAPPPAGHEPVATINAITPSYLGTLKIKLAAGRYFTAADNLAAAPVAIINESMARALFPRETAIGHHLGGLDPKNRGWMEIVGVVPDIHMAVGFAPAATPFQLLRPLAQETWNYVTVAVRAPAPGPLVDSVRQTIAALDPDLAVQQLGTVDDTIRNNTGIMSMVKTILISFALLGLFLASLGLYGVIARVVVQRTPELGVRLALGAESRDIIWLILRSGLRLALWGTAAGLLGAFALGRILVRVLPRPPADDVLIFGAVTLILLGIGLLACWLPARRAAKVDPLVSLRSE